MIGRIGLGGLLAVAVLLAACGGDDDGALDGAVPTVDSTTTTSSTTTTTAAPTTTTTTPTCPKIFEGAGNPDQVDVSADLDGDGRPDRVHSWRPDGGGPWQLQVGLAAGGGAVQEIPDGGVAGVAVIGGYDLDADGADELWVRIGAGASAQILGLFRLDGCDLEPVTLDGDPVELPVGGSVGTASGVSCPLGRDVSLITSALSSTDGGSYDVTTTFYLYADGVLTKTDDSQATLTAGTPDFDAATSFHCGGLDV